MAEYSLPVIKSHVAKHILTLHFYCTIKNWKFILKPARDGQSKSFLSITMKNKNHQNVCNTGYLHKELGHCRDQKVLSPIGGEAFSGWRRLYQALPSGFCREGPDPDQRMCIGTFFSCFALTPDRRSFAAECISLDKNFRDWERIEKGWLHQQSFTCVARVNPWKEAFSCRSPPGILLFLFLCSERGGSMTTFHFRQISPRGSATGRREGGSSLKRGECNTGQEEGGHTQRSCWGRWWKLSFHTNWTNHVLYPFCNVVKLAIWNTKQTILNGQRRTSRNSGKTKTTGIVNQAVRNWTFVFLLMGLSQTNKTQVSVHLLVHKDDNLEPRWAREVWSASCHVTSTRDQEKHLEFLIIFASSSVDSTSLKSDVLQSDNVFKH